MNGALFVGQCLALLVLGCLVAVAGRVMDGKSMEYVRSAGDVPDVAYYGKLEQVFWSVLLRMTTRLGHLLLMLAFVAVLIWQWRLTAYHLGAGWQIAYVFLGTVALIMFTEVSDKYDDGIWLIKLLVGIDIVLMFMHVAGLNHFHTPSFTVPSFNVHLP